MRRREHLPASPSRSTSIGSECSGTWRSQKLSLSSTVLQRNIRVPEHGAGSDTTTSRGRKKKWWVDLWHTRVANTPAFLLTKCIKKLRKHKSSPDGFAAEIVHQLSSNSSHKPSRTRSHHWISRQWTVAASLIPKKPFPGKLSEFRPISSLSRIIKLLGYVWLAAMGNTQFNWFQTGFLRKIDASHGVCLGESKQDGKGMEKPSVPGTAGPQEGLRPRTALLRNHSTTIERGIRAIALGTL